MRICIFKLLENNLIYWSPAMQCQIAGIAI